MSYLSAPSDRDYSAERGEPVQDDTEDVVWCDWCQQHPAVPGDPKFLCAGCRKAHDAETPTEPTTPSPIDTLYEYARDMGFEEELSF